MEVCSTSAELYCTAGDYPHKVQKRKNCLLSESPLVAPKCILVKHLSLENVKTADCDMYKTTATDLRWLR